MNDIAIRDKDILRRELLSGNRIVQFGVALVCSIVFGALTGATNRLGALGVVVAVLFLSVLSAVVYGKAKQDAERKKFIDKRFEGLWETCQDRMARFEEVLRKMKKDKIADLQLMPETVREVSESLYLALRRADIVAYEINQSEQGITHSPPMIVEPTDPQATELYRIADRNVQEYRKRYAAVMGGVQRAEAQSAVFITTLDNLRLKMLGFRLVGKTPEVPSVDFLDALAEARLQLDAIDKALDELDLNIYPKMVAVVEAEEAPLNLG
jgi:hypothetical protein